MKWVKIQKQQRKLMAEVMQLRLEVHELTEKDKWLATDISMFKHSVQEIFDDQTKWKEEFAKTVNHVDRVFSRGKRQVWGLLCRAWKLDKIFIAPAKKRIDLV